MVQSHTDLGSGSKVEWQRMYSLTAAILYAPDVVQMYFSIVAVASFGALGLASHLLNIWLVEVWI